MDTIINKIKDSLTIAIDSLQHHPISKGLIPSAITASPAIFFEHLELGLKITLLVLSIIGAGLTAVAKYLEIKHKKYTKK